MSIRSISAPVENRVVTPMWVGGMLRAMVVGLYMVASLIGAFTPATPQVGYRSDAQVAVGASHHGGCSDKTGAHSSRVVDDVNSNPCDSGRPHAAACMLAGVCADLPPSVLTSLAPAPMAMRTAVLSPIASPMRQGLDPSPDLRPPRLSV